MAAGDGLPLRDMLVVACFASAAGVALGVFAGSQCSASAPGGVQSSSLLQATAEVSSSSKRWQGLVQHLRTAFPSSRFDEEVPQDLNGFWDFAHKVWFAEGWEFMPGGVSYTKEARYTLPDGLQDKAAVQAGQKRPGTLNGFFMGQPIQKYPQDMWLFQEILYNQQPDVIVECGTFMGAAANWYGMLMSWFKPSSVIISIDIVGGQGDPQFFADMQKPNVKYYRFPQGDLDPQAFDVIREHSAGDKKVMVFLDSNHAQDHVFSQLQAYSSLVSVGEYLIVEDTNLDNNPVCQEGHNVLCGGDFQGPNVALQKWLPTQDSFVEETHWKKIYHMTQNSWLKRIK